MKTHHSTLRPLTLAVATALLAAFAAPALAQEGYGKVGGNSAREQRAKRLKELEAENRKLKQLLAESHLDNAALKEVLSKNW